jgi:hypothetical protein
MAVPPNLFFAGFAAPEDVEHGQHEGGGLAGAGLGAGQQVVSFEHRGNGLGLDGGGGFVALLVHGFQNGGASFRSSKFMWRRPSWAHGASACSVVKVHGRASQRQMKYKVGSQKGAFFVPSSMLTLQATGSCNKPYCRMRG